MKQSIRPRSAISTLLTAAIVMLVAAGLYACANPDKPDGGPYDETPPSVVRTSPAQYAVGNKERKITLWFDEYIKLDNAQDKIVISPPQLEQPEIQAYGRRITVNLKDTLIPNTTYTIDFSDAIVDNNESNPMGSYAFVFSTGDKIDTMEVSGTVLNAEDLEPVKGMLVGLHSNMADSAFTTTPLEHIGRTDSRGHFVIKGVAPGKYRIYALNDAENDFTFRQKSEAIAFTRTVVVPSFEPAVREDTVWADSIHIDSIKTVHYTRFMPDDIVLRSFLETQTAHHFIKSERATPYALTFVFSAAMPKPPVIRGLNFNAEGAFVPQINADNDSITLWLRDTALVARDTLELALTYPETDDSTGVDSIKTDTLEMVSRIPYSRIRKNMEDQMAQWQKKRDRALKKGQKFHERQPRQWIRLRYNARNTLAPDENISIRVSEPIERVDTSRIHLELAVDSTWEARPFIVARDSADMLSYTFYGEWRNDQKYRLRLDSAAFTSIYGNNNIRLEMNFGIPSADNFASLFVTLSNYDNGQAYVTLLRGDKPYRTVRADGDHADFYYLTPGDYYMRLFVDQNNNGAWDTGLYSEGRQPEPVYYYPGKIELKRGWDSEQPWDVRSTPLVKQKPAAITKQKAEAKRKIQNRNALRLQRKQQGNKSNKSNRNNQ